MKVGRPIWTRRRVWALVAGLALCLAAGGAAQQTRKPADPREIDGTKTPEKIPDRYAYPVLFGRLTGPDAEEWRGTSIRDSGLAESDAAILFRAAEQYQRLYEEATGLLSGERKGAPRPLPPGVLDQYKLWNDRLNSEVEAIQRSLERDLSAEGNAKLRDYMLKFVKRTMSVHLGDADMPTTVGGDAPVGDTRPAATAPALPEPPPTVALKGPAAAAAIEAAARALVVLQVIDREKDATVELWNASPRPIAAYWVANCAPGLFQLSGLDTLGTPNAPIAVAATHELQVSKRSRPSCNPLTPKTVAVIFDDGTSAGLPQWIEKMKFARLGRMAEVKRVSRILAAVDTPGMPDWSALIQSIGETPEDVEDALQTVIEMGLNGVDADGLKSASWEARSEVFGAVAGVRGTVLSEIKQLAEGPDPATETRTARWEKLREKYRAESRVYEEFRRASAGSLYR